MVIVMKRNATAEETAGVVQHIETLGFKAHLSNGEERTIIGVIGDEWELVTPVARAAVAAGADGLIVKVHPHPAQALSDGAQSLKPDKFVGLVKDVRRVAQAIGRTA